MDDNNYALFSSTVSPQVAFKKSPNKYAFYQSPKN